MCAAMALIAPLIAQQSWLVESCRHQMDRSESRPCQPDQVFRSKITTLYAARQTRAPFDNTPAWQRLRREQQQKVCSVIGNLAARATLYPASTARQVWPAANPTTDARIVSASTPSRPLMLCAGHARARAALSRSADMCRWRSAGAFSDRSQRRAGGHAQPARQTILENKHGSQQQNRTFDVSAR